MCHDAALSIDVRLIIGTPSTHTTTHSEFLSSVGGPEVLIVVAGAKGEDIRIATLGELYPFPSIYRHVCASLPTWLVVVHLID